MKQLLLILSLAISTNLIAQTNFHQVKYIKASTNDVAIKAFIKNGNYLYVASNFSSSYLKTYNIQDPETMYLTDSIKYLSTDRNIYDLFIDGNNLYAIGEKGLTIYSLSNPAKPTQTAFITKVMDGTTERILKSWSGVKSGNIYLCESGWAGLMSVNISNTSQPIYNNITTYSGVMTDIKLINSSTALLCDGYDAYKLNFANPTNLTKTKITILGDPSAICYNSTKNVAYIASTSSSGSWTRLYVLDINTNLKTDSIDLYSYDIDVKDMSLKNSDTLLLGTDNGLMILKVSDINNTSVVEYFDTPYYGGAEDGIISINNNYFIASSYSDIVVYKWGPGGDGINDILGEAITIFPNPANNRLTINGLDHNSTISIYDINGKLVYKSEAITNQIDISNFQNGIYAIKIESENHVIIKKIIKQ